MTPQLVAAIFLASLIALAALALIGQSLWSDPSWFLRRPSRNRFAWVLAIVVSLHFLDATWNTTGPNTCDFACQWLMGRAFFENRAQELYVIGKQKEILALGYQGEELDRLVRDILLKGKDQEPEGTEGPLYPPTDGLIMMPFAMLEPRAAHSVLTLVYVQLVFLSGLLIRDITRGRLGMGEATLICLVFPNFMQGLILGQNSSLTLAIVTGGWALWGRGRPLLAGLVWGLLAYKPVFAVALIWVPLVLWNWRFLAGMIGSGLAFCLATLPWCGIAPWLRWFQVGKNASDLYSIDPNWVWMSRDLVGLPRREMWDWEHLRNHLELITAQRIWDHQQMQTVQSGPTETMIGFALLFGVIGLSIAVFLLTSWRVRSEDLPGRGVWGPRPAFLLFGALLTVFHFMHYDMQPLALPMCLLFAGFDRLSWPSRVILIGLMLGLLYCHMDLSLGFGSEKRPPFETFLLLLLWAWSGGLTVWEAARFSRRAAEHVEVMANQPAVPARAFLDEGAR